MLSLTRSGIPPTSWREQLSDNPGRVEAFFEELAAASATGDARQTQQRRADLAAKYRLGYFTELVPALKAKHRLKLISELTVIRSARKGPRKCRSRPFTAAGSERASRIGRSERCATW